MAIQQGEKKVATDITDLTFFPKGTILTFSSEAWTKTSPAFKEIWKICDGTDSRTPNLTNKFLRGSASSGTMGGTDNQSITLNIDNMPKHNHVYARAPLIHNEEIVVPPPSTILHTSETRLIAQFGGTTSVAGGEQPFTVNTVPSYYTVIYIMKVVE